MTENELRSPSSSFVPLIWTKYKSYSPNSFKFHFLWKKKFWRKMDIFLWKKKKKRSFRHIQKTVVEISKSASYKPKVKKIHYSVVITLHKCEQIHDVRQFYFSYLISMGTLGHFLLRSHHDMGYRFCTILVAQFVEFGQREFEKT